MTQGGNAVSLVPNRMLSKFQLQRVWEQQISAATCLGTTYLYDVYIRESTTWKACCLLPST